MAWDSQGRLSVLFQLEDRRVVVEEGVFVAETAVVLGSVVLKAYSSVWFNTVIRGDDEPITVGRSTNIQDLVLLHTDPGCPCIIGDGVTVGHKVTLHGCEIGDNSLIGINAVVLSGAKIGKNCLIGAHSLITERKEIPDNSMVLGSPGKVVRELSEEEIQGLRDSADRYAARAKRYLGSFQPQK